jgi:hypothetical protein
MSDLSAAGTDRPEYYGDAPAARVFVPKRPRYDQSLIPREED